MSGEERQAASAYVEEVIKHVTTHLREKQPDLLAKLEKNSELNRNDVGTSDVVALVSAAVENDPPGAGRVFFGCVGKGAKSDERSETYREEGNGRFRAGDVPAALEMYNQAVLFASHDAGSSGCLASAYSNRSLCLQKAGRHELAARDIRRALESGYPEENRYKLYQRLLKCHEQLNDLQMAEDTLSKLKDSLEGCRLSSKKKSDLVMEAQLVVSQVKQRQVHSSNEFLTKEATSPSRPAAQKSFLETDSPPHQSIPGASSAVGLATHPERGRHAVAARDVDPGEVLFVDDPLAFALLPSAARIRCRGCAGDASEAPTPCADCADVVYCGEDCRNGDGARIHREYECKLRLNSMFGPDEKKLHRWGSLFLAQLALRIVLLRPPEFFLDGVAEGRFCDPDTSSDPDKDPHAVCFDMVSNVWDLDVVSQCGCAVFLLECLRKCGYLDGVEERDARLAGFSDGRERTEVFFLFLLMHFYAVVQSNNHGFQEVSSISLGVNKRPIGSAIYPRVASMVNHSCDPNTAPVVEAKTLRQITLAARRIAEGEEICHVYQGHFGDTDRSTRQAILRRDFHFSCGCPACVEDFPLARDLPDTYSADPRIVREVGTEKAAELDDENRKMNASIEQATRKRDLAGVFSLYCRKLELAGRCGLTTPHRILLTGRAAVIDQIFLAAAPRDIKVKKGQMVQALYS